LSEGYRRRAKWFLLAIGIVLAVVCNVDAISVAQRLQRDDAVRAAVVAQAEGVADACDGKTDAELTTCLKDETAPASDAVPLPVGWQDFQFKSFTILGWLVTGFALMQGAPFWFDLLQRAVTFRRSREPAGAGA
jgi:hypothetical protein